MRILVVMPPFEVYGPATGGAVSTVAEGLGRAWAGAGHEVVVATGPCQDPYPAGRVEPLDFPRRRPASWTQRARAGLERRLRRYDWPDFSHYSGEVLRVAAETRPDRLVVHNDVVLPALLSPALRGRTVVHVHNLVAVRDPSRATRTLQQVGAVVAVSDFVQADVARRFHPPRLSTLLNGVDARAFRPGTAQRTPAGGALRVAFLGRLLRDKGAHLVAEAVLGLRQTGVAAEVTVIGSPDFHRSASHDTDAYVREVRALVAAAGGVHVPHLARPEVAALLQQQDVLVVPSTFPEPFGLVALEGMAAGCAVLAADVGGLPEAVGDAGLLFPPGDVAALTELLRHLAQDRTELQQRANAGLARAAQQDWSLVARPWLTLLEAVG